MSVSGVRLAGAVLLSIVSATAQAERLSSEDLERKNEGGYVTGLPLLAYSTDIGLGGGARVYYFWNGRRGDQLFARTPYRHRLFLQGFASTKGIQFHWLDYDAPRVRDSRFRVRAQVFYARNINSNYFGFGSSSLEPLRFPGSPMAYDSYGDYAADQKRVQGGMTWGKYDQFDLVRPVFVAGVERLFLSDQVRVMAGIGITYAGIDDYTGEQVDAVDETGEDTTATMAATRLRADCDAGLLVGCEGGRDNLLRLGISYDTRDFEPDPNSGVFVDVGFDIGTAALGSEYDYLRLMVAARGYWSPMPEQTDLVLVGRAVGQTQSKSTPFFEMNTMPFTEDPRTGLGGHRTLRGFRQDRFVGPVMALANVEARWTFARAVLWKQKLAFIVSPFLDVGRPFDSLSDLTLRRWRPAYGSALRISWNLATIVTVDYGVSSEDSGLYINFGHIF